MKRLSEVVPSLDSVAAMVQIDDEMVVSAGSKNSADLGYQDHYLPKMPQGKLQHASCPIMPCRKTPFLFGV